MPQPEQQIRHLSRQRDGRGPRERLLAESFVLFYDRGIRNVGIDLLIARADVAKASFYHHFPSKSDLIVAYLDEREAAWLEWLRTMVDKRASSPETRWATLFDVLADPRCCRRSYGGPAKSSSVTIFRPRCSTTQ